MITESATAPTAAASGWSATVPANFTFSAAGSKTAYAWAKDAAGNVSSSRSASITITLPTETAPSGDINGDSTTNVADALLALQIAVGKVSPSAVQLARGDVAPMVNGKSMPNGKIDIGDVIVLLGKATGKIPL
jgi:hypothetical protein